MSRSMVDTSAIEQRAGRNASPGEGNFIALSCRSKRAAPAAGSKSGSTAYYYNYLNEAGVLDSRGVDEEAEA